MCLFFLQRIGKDQSFSFNNLKKPEKLTKRNVNDKHIDSMNKWTLFKSLEERNSFVSDQIDSADQQHILSNRQYLGVIIECLAFTVQQGIALRGHEENRSSISEVSDINRGNYLELLHLRSRDLPWLKTKLKNQLENHAQWTSPDIQNELLSIIANVILKGSRQK